MDVRFSFSIFIWKWKMENGRQFFTFHFSISMVCTRTQMAPAFVYLNVSYA